MQSSVAEVSLRLLGGFAACVDGVEVGEGSWRLRKARTLVKLLALQPTRRLHREQAMELLWPDRDAVAAQNNLHQALHAARRVLGADRLTLTDGMVALTPDLDTDIDLFTAPEAYAEALELYGGELLPEDRYESWTDARRSALADLHSVLCLELAESRPAQEAVETLQRALAADPLHEPAHRALMRAYDRLGRRQDALAQFHRLRSGLRQALGADPDGATRTLYRELLRIEADDESLAFGAGLPSQITTFVGRARELAAVAERLAVARVLTLTGPGGSGKTRLAIAVAERAAGHAPDGVFFVELAGIAEPQLVAEAAATAVGIRVPSKRTAAEAVAQHLASRCVLLVLDTCEHVVDACAVLVEEILRACQSVTVLATSREPLRCSGETVWRVPGLDATESVELFVSRAREADPAFAVSDQAEIAALCARLDGMPLALELAAARVPSLAPTQIAARLDDSLDVLSSGRRTAWTRQQTLAATIAWSHDLLTGEERVLFRRLAVFAGSFTLAAVADVCSGGALERGRIVELLMRLVDKSLMAVEDAAAARYRLLDTVRQFAAERLSAAGEREAVEARLRDWAQTLAAAGEPLERLELDHDNLRAALDSGLRHDPQGALRLAASIWPFWLDRNYFTEGVRRLRAVLDAAPEATELRATTLLAAGALELRCGELTSFVARGREAEKLARGMRASFAADVVHRTALLYNAGLGFEACSRACEDALALVPDDEWPVRASILNASALVPYYLGEVERSRSRLQASLDALSHVPDSTPFFEGVTFGFAILPEGPEGRLRPLLEETIMYFHRFARGAAEAYCLTNLAMLARGEGRQDETRALLDEALLRFRQLRDERGEAHTLCALGNCARTFGEPDLGLAFLEQSLELRRRSGDRRAVGMTQTDVALALAASGDLAGAEALFTAAHDRFRAADDAPGQGGVLVTWGSAEERSGNLERAAELFAAGAGIWERHLRGHLPGWAWIAAADALLATGDGDRARSGIVRAERLLAAAADTRGLALCREHPAAKSVQRSGKDRSS